MSQEEGKDYIGNKMTDEQEDQKYFTMIYKLNIDKKEKQKIIQTFKVEHFPFDDEKDYKEDAIRILGKYFVERNKNNCKIFIIFLFISHIITNIIFTFFFRHLFFLNKSKSILYSLFLSPNK